MVFIQLIRFWANYKYILLSSHVNNKKFYSKWEEKLLNTMSLSASLGLIKFIFNPTSPPNFIKL